MAGLVPAIHALALDATHLAMAKRRRGCAVSSPGMTTHETSMLRIEGTFVDGQS